MLKVFLSIFFYEQSIIANCGYNFYNIIAPSIDNFSGIN